MAGAWWSSTLSNSVIMSEKVTTFRLSHDQECAMARFTEFLNGTCKVFILKGYAGTGKTTIVKEMIKALAGRRYHYQLLASTGRAAKVLQDSVGETASTIHSCIYTYHDFNQDIERIVEERKQKGEDSQGQLLLEFGLNVVDSPQNPICYIVDEASMVSDTVDGSPCQAVFGTGRLLTDLLDHDPMGKYVFIGDECQLPPVRQPYSPALSADYFREHFHLTAMEVTLTEIKRQAQDNDIVIAAHKLRALYEHPQPWAWAKFPMRGYRHVHLLDSQAELLHGYIQRVAQHGYEDSTLICYTNRQCNTLTHIIRPALGFTSPTLQRGELLLVTQNNCLCGLVNGDMVVVDEVLAQEHCAGLTFLKVSFHEQLTGRKFSQLLIADVLYANQTNLSSPQQKELFIDFYIRMKKKGLKQKSEMFKKAMRSDPYLNALRAVWGFALTCHKVQGGEWNHVFLDIPRSFPKTEKPYVYQWVYTAMTRAREELYVVKDFYIM